MKKIIWYIVLCVLPLPLISQQLSDKWDTMLKSGENYQNYKVIKKSDLADTWKLVQDSLTASRKNLAIEKAVIVSQEAKLNALDKQLADVSGRLANASVDRDSISFLGIQVNKYTYTTTLWILVAITCGACAFFFFRYNTSNRITMQKIKEFTDLSAAFDEHKKNSIEKEKKLKREIQTQMNLLEELKSKPTRV